jgi:hypothetical protein
MFAKGGFTEEAYVTKGAVTLQGVGGEKIPLEQADLIIMNPPFTRAERLPETYKVQLKDRLKDYQDLIFGRVGLHIFFVLLADRFVKNGGRVALVLPATVLRITSMKGARKLWVNNYHVEYIITTWERAAFSEAAQFREILLIAKKLKHHKEKGEVSNSLKCAVVVLKRLPKNLEEANRITNLIRNKKLEMAVHETYSDDNITMTTISQGELKKIVGNMFTLISTSDPQLRELERATTLKAGDKLTVCDQFFKKNDIDAYEDVYIPPFNSTFVVQRSRAIKKQDIWVVKEEKPKTIIAENRFLGTTINIPSSALKRGFRRPAGCNILDISDDLDYIVVDKFSGAEQIFPNKSKAERAIRNIGRWKEIVNSKEANLVISRRFDISAKGTKLLAFYSATPIFGVDMWSVKGFNEEEAKIFVLWFNSTLNLLQMLIYRTETRGAWMKLHEYQIRESMMLNPNALTHQERKHLLDLFVKLKKQEFPSILEQLKIKFPLRVEIDKAVFRVLGFGDDEISRILDYLYPALANEIEQLKRLMEG